MPCKALNLILFGLLTHHVVIPMDAPIPQNMSALQYINQGTQNFKNGHYANALRLFEMAYATSQNELLLHAKAAGNLALMHLQVEELKDYKKALEYAEEAYNITKDPLAREPRSEDSRSIYARAASCLGRIYKDALGVKQDYTKALGYFTESYNASKDDPVLRATNAYDLGEIYAKTRALDNDHTKSIAFFEESLVLGGKYSPEMYKLVEAYLKELLPKDPVAIEFEDKSRKKFDLQSKAHLQSVDQVSQKTFRQLIDAAHAHGAEFIIARVQVRNEGDIIGSFYCAANDLIPRLWEVGTVCGVLSGAVALNSQEILRLKDGREILGIQFFEWNKEERLFNYLFNDKELFEGYSGRRKRLILCAQNYNDILAQIIARLLLAEMYFLGLGGPKDLEKAHDCVDFVLKNAGAHKKNLPYDIEQEAKIWIARIQLELGIEHIKSEPKLGMTYLQRAGFQKDNPLVQLNALMYLDSAYEQRHERKQELLCINTIVQIKGISPLVQSYYLKRKKDIEAELDKQSSQQLAVTAQKKIEAPQVELSKPIKKKKKRPKRKKSLQKSASDLPKSTDQVATDIGDTKMINRNEKEEEKETENTFVKERESVPVTEEPTVSLDREKVFNSITAEINGQKVESLLKEFDKSLASYLNKRHISYLRDAKEALEKAESLKIDDNSLQTRMTKARKDLDEAFNQPTTKSEAGGHSSSASSSQPKTILDPFGERSNIPSGFKKSLDDSLNNLAINPYGSGAKRIQNLDNVWRIHIGHDYRLLYTVMPNAIGIVGLAKKGKSTYKNLADKYKHSVEWFSKIGSMKTPQLRDEIERERELGHKEKERALIELYLFMTQDQANDKTRQMLQERLKQLPP